jgi:hypothetical protein
VDAGRHAAVSAKLAAHETNANTWRTTSLNYFQTFSKTPISGCSPVITLQDPRMAPGLPQRPQPIHLYQASGRLLRILPGNDPDFGQEKLRAGKDELPEGVYFLRQGGTGKRILIKPSE